MRYMQNILRKVTHSFPIIYGRMIKGSFEQKFISIECTEIVIRILKTIYFHSKIEVRLDTFSIVL